MRNCEPPRCSYTLHCRRAHICRGSTARGKALRGGEQLCAGDNTPARGIIRSISMFRSNLDPSLISSCSIELVLQMSNHANHVWQAPHDTVDATPALTQITSERRKFHILTRAATNASRYLAWHSNSGWSYFDEFRI